MINKILKNIFAIILCLNLFDNSGISVNVNAANILGFFVSPSPSHMLIDAALIKGLLAKGHNITVVTALKTVKFGEPSDNYHEIYIDIKENDKEFMSAMPSSVSNSPEKPVGVLHTMRNVMGYLNKRCDVVIKHEKMQNLFNSGSHFDLFLLGYFLNDFTLGIAGHFRCPIVVVAPVWPFRQLRELTGNPASIASVPFSPDENSSEPMTFYQRVANFLTYTHELLLATYYRYYVSNPFYEDNFPAHKGYPTYDEVRKNVSLVLTPTHFSQGYVRPLVPNLVEIAGIQIKSKADPLPPKIQSILDNATEHGAIFLSFGSNVKSDVIGSDKLKAMLASFSKIKQSVLMKWDTENLPFKKPENVHIGKWLPQDDILAHPNLRLFISHCGAGSVSEARYHGVPILAMPLFADQFTNAKSIVSEGWSIQIKFGDLTESILSDAIKEILTNAKYKNIVQKQSKVFRDRPQSALDTAVFWTEYVLRHNGAWHMQSPAVHLNFLQQNSLDVIAFLVIFIYIVIKVFVALMRFLVHKSFSKKSKQKVN